MVTIYDVAKEAGVSTATVSYALNGKPGVSEKSREKILAIAESMGFVPNSAAKSLTSKKTGMIGVVISDTTPAYFSSFLQHLQYYARQNDYFIILGSNFSDFNTEKEIIHEFISKGVDAIVISPDNNRTGDFYVEIVKTLDKHHIPLLFFNSYFPDLTTNYIVPDLEEGAYRMTEYLIENGQTDLLFFGGVFANTGTRSRYRGFTRALTDHGISYQTNNHIECGYGFKDGYQAAKNFLSHLQSLPRAFVCINDYVALGLYKALREKGINVPLDVSITGYDDIEVPTFDELSLTTVRIPLDEMSRLCISCFKEHGKGQTLHQYIIQPQLVIRSSVRENPIKKTVIN